MKIKAPHKPKYKVCHVVFCDWQNCLEEAIQQFIYTCSHNGHHQVMLHLEGQQRGCCRIGRMTNNTAATPVDGYVRDVWKEFCAEPSVD